MKALSASELEIMLRIWESNGPLTFEEINESVSAKNWSENTVRSFLQRMVNKGYLKVSKQGRYNLYSPLVSADYINRQGRSILSKLYEDSVQNFVAQLYQTDALTREDLQELKVYLEDILKEE